MNVSLLAKSKKGKDRLHQHGRVWKIIKDEGDKLLLQSLSTTLTVGDRREFDLRWVHKTEDKDFEIERTKG